MYNLIDYGDSYSDTSGSLWQFKRDEQNRNNGNPADISTHDSSSLKYQASFLGEPIAAANNTAFKDLKTTVPLNYLSNFWRSLKASLINCKIHVKLNWTKICVMSNVAGNIVLMETNANLYISIFTLSTEDNVKLKKN